MITKQKVEIYKYYDGDIDRFSHGNKDHKKIMSEEDFFLITRMIQDFIIIKNGLAAKEFQQKVEKSLEDNCDNHETIDFLKFIA